MEQIEQYKKMKTTELSALCEQQGLPKSGAKSKLIERLVKGKRKADGSDSPASKRAKGEEVTMETVKTWIPLKIADLKTMIKEQGLKVTGTKGQLIIRLYTGENHSKDEEEDLINKHFCKNKLLQDTFEKLAHEADGFKANSLRGTALCMRLWPEVITSAKQMKGVKGFGKGTLDKIERILKGEDVLEGAGSTGFAAPAPEEKTEEKAKEEALEDVLKDNIVLKLTEDESPDGLTIEELKGVLTGDVSEIESVIAALVSEGKVFTTCDDEHFKAA